MDLVDGIRTILTYLATFVLGVGSAFFLTYSTEKAKNKAIREDIGKITKEIENVKQDIIHQNNLVLEEVKGRHQLRIAALDRRLQAHQEAFTLWRKLLSKLYSDTIQDVVIECQDWWNNNCIYLSPEARHAFRIAYQTAFFYKELRKERSTEENKEEWKLIEDAGEAIVKGAELPPLGKKESEILELAKHEKAVSTSKP